MIKRQIFDQTVPRVSELVCFRKKESEIDGKKDKREREKETLRKSLRK